MYGIDKSYKIWSKHGEIYDPSSISIQELADDTKEYVKDKDLVNQFEQMPKKH